MEELTPDDFRKKYPKEWARMHGIKPEKKPRQPKVKGPNTTEQIAQVYLQAKYPQGRVEYEPMDVHLRGCAYRPDFVVLIGAHHRVFVEVKHSNRFTRWRGWRFKESVLKLKWLSDLVGPWGWQVVLVTVENGRVVKEQEFTK